MRWHVEAIPLGGNVKKPARRLTVEADNFQKALGKARDRLGDKAPASALTIEADGEGCQATNAIARTRFIVRKAADNAPIKGPEYFTPDDAPASRRPSVAPAPVAPSKPPTAVAEEAKQAAAAPKAKPGTLIGMQAAAFAPRGKVLSRRSLDPSEKNPLCYREVALEVPKDMPRDVAVTAARAEIDELMTALDKEGISTGIRFLHVGVFDHAWLNKPEKPPIFSLVLKDWRGNEALVRHPDDPPLSQLPPPMSERVAPISERKVVAALPLQAGAAPTEGPKPVVASDEVGTTPSQLLDRARQEPKASASSVAKEQLAVKPATPMTAEAKAVAKEEPKKSAPPAAKEEPKPSVPPAAKEEPKPSVPPAAKEEPKPSVPPAVKEEPKKSVPPAAKEEPKPSAPPAAKEEPKPSAPPAAKEEPKPSAPPAAKEEPKKSVPPAAKEEPKKSVPPAAKEEPKPSVPPAAKEEPKKSVPPAAKEEPKKSVPPAAKEEPKKSVPPAAKEEPKKSVPPAAKEEPKKSVPPAAKEEPKKSVPPAAKEPQKPAVVAKLGAKPAPVVIRETKKSTGSGKAVRVGRSDDLMSDLFENIHDLHFLRDALEGAEFVLELLSEHVPTRTAFIHLYDINKREWVLVRAKAPNLAVQGRRTPEDFGLLGEVAKRGRASLIGRAGDDPRINRPCYQDAGHEPTNVVAVCVRAGQRYLGALEIADHLDGQILGEAEANGLTYLAEQFAEFLTERGIILTDETSGGHPVVAPPVRR